jgi:hypothetical protein
VGLGVGVGFIKNSWLSVFMTVGQRGLVTRRAALWDSFLGALVQSRRHSLLVLCRFGWNSLEVSSSLARGDFFSVRIAVRWIFLEVRSCNSMPLRGMAHGRWGYAVEGDGFDGWNFFAIGMAARGHGARCNLALHF